jgi:hypothetical protein
MKIQKFNKINEQLETTKYWVFVEPADDDYEMECYIFDNNQDSFNFLVNRIYRKYKYNNLNLDDLDILVSECENDVTCLYETYQDILEKYRIDNLLLTYEKVKHSIEIEDWIQLRFNAKNYNL